MPLDPHYARRHTPDMTDTPLKLFNSLTRELEEFTPVHPGEARVYSCVPTVYTTPISAICALMSSPMCWDAR